MVPPFYRLVLTSAITSPLALIASTTSLTLEERIARLEKEVSTLRGENAALKERLDSAPSDPVHPIRVAGQETWLSIGGFVQVNAEFGDAPDDRWSGATGRDRFLLRRARLGLQGQWKEPLSFKLEADFGNGGISGRSGYSGQITDGYATLSASRAFNIRLGQFKTPFGYEQIKSDTQAHTIERSLPNDRLTLGRQIGLGVFGEWGDSGLTYSAGLFNGNGLNQGLNDNDRFLTAARISAPLLKTHMGDLPLRLTMGANGYLNTVTTDVSASDRQGWGFDSQLTVGGFELTAEILGLSTEAATQPEVRSLGWNVLVAWRLPAAPDWTVVARFESYEANTAATDTRSENRVLGMTYRLRGDDLRFSVNYILGNPAGPLSQQGRLLTGAQLIY